MKRFRERCVRAVLVGGLVGALAVPVGLATSAGAHGWVTSPPSRQDHCRTGTAPFDCGQVRYEPQSVEAPKGSMRCSGGNAQFAVLDDASKPWPVTPVGRSVTFQWKLTAAHNTSTWEYFVDGVLHRTFDQGGAQPSATISHTLTDLPTGRHTVLARWNVSNTAMAFYSCVDLQVGGGTTTPTPTPTPSPTPTSPTPTPSPTPTDPGTCAATPWSAAAVYTGGARVSYAGRTWQAQWWTQGEAPRASDWGVWRDLGACSTTAVRTARTAVA
ncbi:lytic polysaccharide monooxygenase [Cellulomonas cellasea]|uniref:Putative carbohydrate-binding protein with CBM5 and CBM33 domain n=1 Tax=Cellulomonas cellasea TaxID=43670 RepID=A0A7W4UG63_9CELL|nr:lytic polysaccharide monooxygenase [Cellulomonas cellasea]MBB2922983.1 putative carbohydrate-binding protein with CBM5 and CBM33 domain [Cellulomonas cellasea]